MPETAARLRYYRTSPTKVRQVLRLIVGQDVTDARETLRFCERGPADEVMKLLDSAVANAEHNDNLPEDELYVARAFADEGPTLKRWRPRARGRGTRVRKRTSHVTVVVARFTDDQLEQRREREAAAGAPTRVSRRRRVAASRRRAEARHEHDHDHDEDGEPVPAADAAVEAAAAGDEGELVDEGAVVDEVPAADAAAETAEAGDEGELGGGDQPDDGAEDESEKEDE
jgi:large subunit ribosomal protein L22